MFTAEKYRKFIIGSMEDVEHTIYTARHHGYISCGVM